MGRRGASAGRRAAGGSTAVRRRFWRVRYAPAGRSWACAGLLREIPAAGRVMTMDALQSCPERVRLIAELGADYAMPVKDNRPTPLDDIRLLDWDSAAEFKTLEKGYGRIETRRRRAIPLDGAPPNQPPCPDAARPSASISASADNELPHIPPAQS